MNKAERAGAELRAMDELAAQDSAVHRMPPLSKLFLTVLYIAVTVSFNKYDFTGLLVMLLFPVVAYQISEIPISTCFYKLRIVMPLVKPAWLTLIITTFQNVWNSGASTYVWSEQLKTFNSAVATISTVSTGAGSAAAVLTMAVPIIIFVVSQAQIVETMGSSGMKD